MAGRSTKKVKQATWVYRIVPTQSCYTHSNWSRRVLSVTIVLRVKVAWLITDCWWIQYKSRVVAGLVSKGSGEKMREVGATRRLS